MCCIFLFVVGFNCFCVTEKSKTLAKSIKLMLLDLWSHYNMLIANDLRVFLNFQNFTPTGAHD